MSNNTFLCGSDYKIIYPAFSQKIKYSEIYNSDEQTYLESAGCIPLLWILLFKSEDFVTETFITEEGNVTVSAPVVEREIAISRIRKDEEFVKSLFNDNGNLSYYIDLFVNHLESNPKFKYISLELQEIEWLYEEGYILELLKTTLNQLNNHDIKGKEGLIELTTVLIDREFRKLTDEGNEIQDFWNFFRIMGDGFIRETEWS